jgi:GT2 family glycosyltransferase
MRSITVVKSKEELGDGLTYNIEGLKRFGRLLVLHGWIVDPAQRLCLLSVSLPGRSAQMNVLPRLLRFDRPDVKAAFNAPQATAVTHYGFVAVVMDIPLVDNLATLGLAVVSSAGKLHVSGVPVSQIDCSVDSLPLLTGIFTDSSLSSVRCERFYEPIFQELIARVSQPVESLNVRYGKNKLPKDPALSVIIPLYGSTRFEVTQIPALAALATRDWEIILAVDDPRILNDVRTNAERLAGLYGLQVRVLAAAENLGFSGINNFAAERAKGRYLLFLNSDCFIARREPIDRAMAWLDGSEKAGATGFRLMYADRTIQHDGMSVSRWNDDEHFLLNDHPRMGLPVDTVSSHPDDDEAVMLTAACLMMRREVFTAVGGFDRSYLRGDFEDSDLCLKLVSRGLKLGIVRDDSIFHLERQTIAAQEAGLRQKITLVNSWIYTRKWHELLANGLTPLEVIE